jgi:hypothetical protein
VLRGSHRTEPLRDRHSWVRCRDHPQKKVFCPYPLLFFSWPEGDPDQFEKPDRSWDPY